MCVWLGRWLVGGELEEHRTMPPPLVDLARGLPSRHNPLPSLSFNSRYCSSTRPCLFLPKQALLCSPRPIGRAEEFIGLCVKQKTGHCPPFCAWLYWTPPPPPCRVLYSIIYAYIYFSSILRAADCDVGYRNRSDEACEASTNSEKFIKIRWRTDETSVCQTVQKIKTPKSNSWIL